MLPVAHTVSWSFMRFIYCRIISLWTSTSSLQSFCPVSLLWFWTLPALLSPPWVLEFLTYWITVTQPAWSASFALLLISHWPVCSHWILPVSVCHCLDWSLWNGLEQTAFWRMIFTWQLVSVIFPSSLNRIHNPGLPCLLLGPRSSTSDLIGHDTITHCTIQMNTKDALGTF